jgi:hypothetical protein
MDTGLNAKKFFSEFGYRFGYQNLLQKILQFRFLSLKLTFLFSTICTLKNQKNLKTMGAWGDPPEIKNATHAQGENDLMFIS